MTDALEDHEGSVSIGGRTITDLHFADAIAGKEKELYTGWPGKSEGLKF